MDRSSFSAASPGELVSIPGGVAYVPGPLPPQLHLSLTLTTALEAAGRAVGELNGLARILPDPALLVIPYLRREAVLSSRIEGTQATLSDVLMAEAGATPPAGSDTAEVLRYIDALDYGRERLNEIPLSLNLIREIHQRLMATGGAAAPGEFRRNQVHIGAMGTGVGEARYVPPPADRLMGCLDAWEKYVHADDPMPPLIRSALLHYQFEAIHPFYDGNGRVGRIVLLLDLLAREILTVPMLPLSAYFEADRAAYYDGLLRVSQRGAWEDWIVYFLRALAIQAAGAVEDCRRLLDLRDDLRTRTTKARVRPTTVRAVEQLFENPYLTTKLLQKQLHVTATAAQTAIDQLQAMGVLRELTGRARGRIYVAPEVLTAIEGSPSRGPREAQARLGF